MMKRYPIEAGLRFLGVACAIAVVAAESNAFAQTATPSGAICEPTCRSGFLCLDGQCVSACNPPCAAGQICSATAECVAAPAPAGYPPPTAAAAAPPGYPAAYPPPWTYAPYAPPPPDPGRHLHDGFFLRLGTGFAYTSLHFSDEVAGDTDVSSGGIAIDVTIGGAIKPGIILAGSIYGGSYPNPSIKSADGSSADAPNTTLSVFGGAFLVDYYPDASGGFHFGGDFGVGGASLQNQQTGMTSEHNPVGITTAAHIGYEFWISDQWSVGGLFKLSYVNLKREGSATYSTFSVSGVQPLFVAAFTFN